MVNYRHVKQEILLPECPLIYHIKSAQVCIHKHDIQGDSQFLRALTQQ